MSTNDSCQVSEMVVGRRTRAVRLENEFLRAVILADKGADIYELTYKPAGLDVLFKSPWGFRDLGSIGPSAADSQMAWIDHYPGGWQEIFPNFGAACVYQGVEWAFHGEVATASWDYRVLENTSRRASVRFEVRTTRTPFRLERTMTVEAGRPELLVQERLTNEGTVEMPYMWGHHPAYGAPFLSGDCRLDTPGQRYKVIIPQVSPDRTWMPDQGDWPWPNVVGRDGKTHDLSRIPGPESHLNTLGFVADLDEGWYGLTNTKLGFGVGIVWPKEIFPYLWLWQELNSTPGYPWYGRVYVMGVELHSSVPGAGLLKALEAGAARRIAAGASLEIEFRCLFYQSSRGVKRIRPDGAVEPA